MDLGSGLYHGPSTPKPWTGTDPQPVRNWAVSSVPCPPGNRSLVPKRLGTAGLYDSSLLEAFVIFFASVLYGHSLQVSPGFMSLHTEI